MMFYTDKQTTLFTRAPGATVKYWPSRVPLLLGIECSNDVSAGMPRTWSWRPVSVPVGLPVNRISLLAPTADRRKCTEI